jgi:hypothetical protein
VAVYHVSEHAACLHANDPVYREVMFGLEFTDDFVGLWPEYSVGVDFVTDVLELFLDSFHGRTLLMWVF